MPYPFDSNAYGSLLNQYPSRPIRGTDIFEKQGDELILIGHTLPWCNDLESTLNEALATAEKHYNRLVELGDIVPKESTEDMLLKAMKAIDYLAAKVDKMEAEKVERRSDHRDSKGRFESSKPQGGKSAGRSATDTASDAGLQ